MIRHFMFLVMLLLLVCATAGAAEKVENPKECRLCGMDRIAFARSRMLITYVDGTTTGVCSLHCAIEEIEQNKDKQVKSLQVADYMTKELIDAGTATWVIGGKKSGGMNSPAKWAFAREEDAQRFVQENGGAVTTYDRLTQLANQEVAKESKKCCNTHTHEHMGAGGQMLFNPAFGDDIYHTHPAGMWMANYKYMHMVQNGLRNGTTDVPAENATPMGNQPFGFMMAPTSMTMDMHMAMVMYGLTDRLTLMGMGTYLVNEMEMVMNMGMGNRPDSPMRTSGLGDTELRGIYKINDYLTASLGVGIPSGDIDQEIVTMGRKFRAPYDMQLGSGTVDLKPALTYTALSDDAKWNWGGQTSSTYHVGHNGNGYSLGDNVKATGWLQRALGPATTWLRLAYNYTGSINGRDAEIDKLLDPVTGAPTPDADPGNYGGHRLDGFAGVSYTAGPVSIGVEAGIPLYQYLNGLQLKNDWYLTAGIQGMF
jgi:nitrous oxide reductase accessory protein NosL